MTITALSISMASDVEAMHTPITGQSMHLNTRQAPSLVILTQPN